MSVKKITFAFVVTVVVTIGLIAGNHSFASHGAGANALEGGWKVRITATALPPLDELITFSAGGGIVETNNFPFHRLEPQPLAAGPGHGTWKYNGRQRFSFTFIKFLFLPNGDAAGTLKVIGEITYSPANDTWSGPATVTTCDTMANNCVFLDTTNGQATRIVAGQ